MLNKKQKKEKGEMPHTILCISITLSLKNTDFIFILNEKCE